ncbi:hypothetical protein MOQ06_09315 [Enterobacter sp. I4]|uniref:hypothetical protein n=1 Tax=Enterobacter TaxID=547 RepID=UPI001F5A79AF|nr:hypothetical protein [Enterobacter sp. I4]
MDFIGESYLKIILINLFNSAKYKAGKYQMVPPLANTFCKFVKHFSFIAPEHTLMADANPEENAKNACLLCYYRKNARNRDDIA